MKYYERLRDLREDNDLSQKDIAEILETSHSKISDYENGNIMMRVDKYMKLARYYNISLDYLTGMIDTPRALDETAIGQARILTAKEKRILQAYKNHPEHQKTIDKILDLN